MSALLSTTPSTAGTPVVLIYNAPRATERFCVDQAEKTLKHFLPHADIKLFETLPPVPLKRRNIQLFVIPGGNAGHIQKHLIDSKLLSSFDAYLINGDYLGFCAGAIVASQKFFLNCDQPSNCCSYFLQDYILNNACSVDAIAPLVPLDSNVKPIYKNKSPMIRWTFKNTQGVDLPLYHNQGPCLFSMNSLNNRSSLSFAVYRDLEATWKTECGQNYQVSSKENGSAAVFATQEDKIANTVGRAILLGVHPEFNPHDIDDFINKSDSYDREQSSYFKTIINQLKKNDEQRKSCMQDILKRLNLLP